MGAAAAQITGEGIAYFVVAGIFILRQQRGRGHDHAVDAIAALHRLLVDESLL